MRIAENLNLALADLLAARPGLLLLGEDIVDPYGGAFKITRGLSRRFPDRVLATPLSEGGIVGVAAGLALAGDGAVVEIMFSDFATLAFDQLTNFAAKSVTMYGRRVPMPMVVRCPTGGGRGYGPTHSQSLQKHFVGVPGLTLYELSPCHDNRPVLDAILERGEPAMFFEDKMLYPQRMYSDGVVDDLFSYDLIRGADGIARIYAEDPEVVDCVLIVPGGMTRRALSAARALLMEEIFCTVLVPSRLYPFDLDQVAPLLRAASVICVAEESTSGGTWGAEVASGIYRQLWTDLRRPVVLVSSTDRVIPTAAHLESQVLVQDTTISRAITEALRD